VTPPHRQNRESVPPTAWQFMDTHSVEVQINALGSAAEFWGTSVTLSLRHQVQGQRALI
jgi:hypothetical protein